MNIQQMKYAIEVEKTGSISQAADNLYMGQPNLSKAIKELETSLGIKIFRRTSKGVFTTPQGEEFLERAKKIVAEIDEMESYYRSESPERQGFRISVPRSSYIASAFTAFVGSLVAERDIPVVFSETNAMHAIRNIIDEGYHLGIIRYQTACEPYFLQLLADQHLQHREIWEYESLALMSAEHPAADKEVIGLSDLEGHIELIHGDCGVHNHLQCESNRGGKGHCSHKKICIYERGSQLDLLTRLPDTYMWVSPVPSDVLERNNLVQKRCVGYEHRCKDVLIYPKGYTFNNMENKFLQKLDEAKRMVAMEEESVTASAVYA